MNVGELYIIVTLIRLLSELQVENDILPPYAIIMSS